MHRKLKQKDHERRGTVKKEHIDFVEHLIALEKAGDPSPKRTAYRKAFNNYTGSDVTISNRSYNLLKRDDVSKLYAEKKSKELKVVKEKASWTIEQADTHLQWLVEQTVQTIAKNGVRQGTGIVLINAIKELNDLHSVGKRNELEIKKLEREIEGSANIEDILQEQLALTKEAINAI